MSSYGWGAASLVNLGTCDPLLILLFRRAIKRADLKRDSRPNSTPRAAPPLARS